MKIFIYVLIAASVVIIIYNATKLNPDHLLQGDSSVAIFGIISGLCSILVLTILLIARRISAKSRR